MSVVQWEETSGVDVRAHWGCIMAGAHIRVQTHNSLVLHERERKLSDSDFFAHLVFCFWRSFCQSFQTERFDNRNKQEMSAENGLEGKSTFERNPLALSAFD